MTVTNTEFGYLASAYLVESYLAGFVYAQMGGQFEIVIDDDKPLGVQYETQIVDFQKPTGFQYTGQVTDTLEPLGFQYEASIDDTAAYGFQYEGAVESPDDDKFLGIQAEFQVATEQAYGWEYWKQHIAHIQKPAYLVDDYLTTSYLAFEMCGVSGMQAEFQIVTTSEIGTQYEGTINTESAYGFQYEAQIDTETAYGYQTDFITVTPYGYQFLISLYNTTNIRLMCEFPSRGLSSATGNNQWGNPAGIGQNWNASHTETGDFDASNLNTDIVEQVWRTPDSVITGITLDCDTERTQGVFMDTFAILNHNLTTSADILLIGSNDPTFVSIGVSIPLQARALDPNIYYIAPELPNAGYRYWRIQIDDASNTDDFVSIGTIVFGASDIFFGECIVDQIDYQLRDFADRVETEGFTNVSNSRAQKKLLRVDFRSLDYTRGNFQLMRRVFSFARTTLKCLWIPTPDKDSADYTARFAVFSKMTQVPLERHNVKGRQLDYVSFTVELDESK